MGRPSKLTPEIQEAFVKAIAEGLNYAQACNVIGVSYTAYRKWRRKGRSGQGVYGAFVAEIKRAEAEAIRQHLAAVTSARDKSWQAAAWWLERKYPHIYGQQRHEIAEIKRTLAEIQKEQQKDAKP